MALGNSRARVIDVCGHTRGHLAYWFEEDEIVFVGDTLFSLGCGKVFEGSMAEMPTRYRSSPIFPTRRASIAGKNIRRPMRVSR